MTILDEEGAAALSMRRLASELGVTPMALYRHAAGKESLAAGGARPDTAMTHQRAVDFMLSRFLPDRTTQARA